MKKDKVQKGCWRFDAGDDKCWEWDGDKKKVDDIAFIMYRLNELYKNGKFNKEETIDLLRREIYSIYANVKLELEDDITVTCENIDDCIRPDHLVRVL